MEAVLNSFESNIHLVVFGNIAPEMKKRLILWRIMKKFIM